MYNEYFGFSESPFNITPSSRFYFRTLSCEEVLGIVHHGIDTRKGIIVVTGLPGTGKTLLLKFLVRDLDSKGRTVIVQNPHTDLSGLLRLILNRLDLHATADDSTAMFDRLTDYLVEQRRNGRIVCLLIDEAQDLSDNTLDELRLLSNLDFEDEALLPIVLLGQPELNIKLDRPSTQRIKQRIALTRHIYPLTRREVGPYIDSRLKVAKYERTGLFDPEAIEKISAYSRGIPRMVNSICDNSLIRAYKAKQSVVSPEIIDQVARELRIAAPRLPQNQASPPGFSDFGTKAAPLADDDTEPVATEVMPSPAEEPVAEPLDVENPDAVHPQSSGSAASHRFATTEDPHGYSDGDTSTASHGKDPPKIDLDPRASNVGWSHFYVLPRERSAISLFRSRWIAVAAVTGLLLLAIGNIVSSWRIADNLSVAAIYKQPAAPDAPSLPPEPQLATESEEYDGSLSALPGPAAAKPVEIEIANSEPIEQPANSNSAVSETRAKQPEPTEVSQLQPPQAASLPRDTDNALSKAPTKQPESTRVPQPQFTQDAESRREKPANSPPVNGNESKPHVLTLKVVGASMVRDKPSDKAKIIGTLDRGSRIKVLAKSRDYYHVHSLQNNPVRGYVHREDAFFERVK